LIIRVKTAVSLFWFLLRLSVWLVAIDSVLSGSGDCNPIPRLQCSDTEIQLTLRIIQPCMRLRIYTNMQD